MSPTSLPLPSITPSSGPSLPAWPRCALTDHISESSFKMPRKRYWKMARNLCGSSGDDPGTLITKNGNEKLNTKNCNEKLNTKNSTEKLNTKNSTEKMNTKNCNEKLNTKNSTEKLNTKNCNEKLNTKNSTENLNAKNCHEKLNTKNSTENSNTKSCIEKLNAIYVGEIMDLESLTETLNQTHCIDTLQMTQSTKTPKVSPQTNNFQKYGKTEMQKVTLEPISKGTNEPTLQSVMLQGNFHQGSHSIFGETTGTPCVVNSLVSVLYSDIKLIHIWQSFDLDQILLVGHETYCKIQQTLHWKNPLLLIDEIPRQLEIMGKTFQLSFGDSLVGLVLGQINDFAPALVMSLHEALDRSLRNSNGCFVTFRGQTFSIIKCNSKYYRFDSHSRDANGMQATNGTSVLIEADSVSEVCRQCKELALSMSLSDDEQFEITSITINSCTEDRNKDLTSSQNILKQTDMLDHPEEDCVVLQHTTMEKRVFDPLTDCDKDVICNAMGITTSSTCNKFSKTPIVPLANPCNIQQISGDGNCFFRAISFAISGTEGNHIRIRRSVVKHLERNEDVFGDHLRAEYTSVVEYLQRSSMYYSGTWATEVEIHATAHLLLTDIYTYTNNSWLKFAPLNEDANYSVKSGIYLLHDRSHYSVVLCVKSPTEQVCNICAQGYQNERNNRSQIGADTEPVIIAEPESSKLSQTTDNQKLKIGKGLKKRPHPNTKKKLAKRIRYNTDQKFRESKQALRVEKYKKERTELTSPCKGLQDSDLLRKTRNQIKSLQRYHDNSAHICSQKIKKYQTNSAYRQKVKAESMLKYRTVSSHREKVRAESVSKYKTNSAHRQKLKEQSVSKYKTNSAHRHKVKAESVSKYKTNSAHRQKLKDQSVSKYKTNSAHRQKVKDKSVLKYELDDLYRQRAKRRSIQKYADISLHKENVKERSIKKYRSDAEYRKELKLRNRNRRSTLYKNRTLIDTVITDFRNQTSQGPDYVCCVCHRLLFENQVVKCRMEYFETRGHRVKNVSRHAISHKYLHQCSSLCDSPCVIGLSNRASLWICHTCQRKLFQGKIPAEASVNNLALEQIPKELECLNTLEQHLVSLHIPFIKMIALPKGGQRAAHGPVVCVPSNINKSTSILPRCQTDDQLLRLKLKRKLAFKGHYEYQFVKTSRLKEAISYLKNSNKWYKDITFDESWTFSETELNSTDGFTGESDKTNSEMPSEHSDHSDSEDELPDLCCVSEDISNHEESGPLLDTCLQPVDIGQELLDQYSDDVLCVAPGEGNAPIQILRDESDEAKSFPTLFPSGTGTFCDDRGEKLTLSRYLHTRLMSADNRFAKDISYIFHSQYRSEIYQVLSSISIAVRKGSVSNNGKPITARMLTNKDSLKDIVKADEGYKFLKPIRGTPAYWQCAQKDVFAMLRQLGIPTWFASFSSADMRWPEVVESILRQQGDSRKAENLDWADKCDILRSNPVSVARMFEHRFQVFLNKVILSPAAPIGKVIDYFFRVEFQQRGSPHIHALFWVENAPKLDKDGDQDVTNFIDKYVSCQLPDPEDDDELHKIVTEVQRHSSKHSKTCKKKGTVCRFNFPRPPSNNTFIVRPPEEENERKRSQVKPTKDQTDNRCSVADINLRMTAECAKEILNKMWTALTGDKQYASLHDILSDIGLSESDYQHAFEVISKKTNVMLRRSPHDIWINQYNKDCLRCWNANMDLQYVLDAYSCVVYIVSYMSKAEREMSLLLEHTHREMVKDGNSDVKLTMKQLGTVYLHNREVSAQEAVYRVCNLKLKQCSRKVQFIPVGPDPVKMTLPLNTIKTKAKQTDVDSDEIWMTSIVDRYKNRPEHQEFQHMCLATFCSEYRILYGQELANAPDKKNAHKLLNDLGFIQKRSRSDPAVIRYPRFSASRTPEKYYHSILQLFLPHRTDEQLKPKQFERFEDFYHTGAVRCNELQSVKHLVDNNRAQFEIDADDIDRAQNNLEEFGPLEDAWAQICPESESNRLECQNVLHDGINIAEEEPDDNIPDLLMNSKANNSKENHIGPSLITRRDAEPLLRSLNVKQSEVFYKIRQWCIEKANGRNPDEFHVFVTGGAGTGKSHVIKTIHYEASRILAPSMPNPDDISVMVTAPTGVAAFNIGASTLHSAFSIRTDAKLPYQPLSEDKLNTLRTKFGNLQILIIDEISMVDHKMLCYIHGRLRQIKQTRDYSSFGKVSIIAVGDFYQLPPVKGTALFVEQHGVDLWNGVFNLVALNEIMRQKDDIGFASLLNRIRTKASKEKLSDDDLTFLTARVTGEMPINSLYIFATNNEVDTHNMNVLDSLCENPIHIEAEDYTRDSRTGKLQKRNEHHSQVYNSSLSKSVTLGVGARVLLTKNIDVSDGLVNGVFGTVTNIVVSRDSIFPSAVNVLFDNTMVGQKLRRSKPGTCDDSTPIEPQEDTVNNKGGVRRQFPLKLAWASTVHKVQGLTVSNAVVSLNKIFSAGQAYVSLSRVTSAAGLIIQDLKEDKIYCNPKVEKALSQMPSFTAPEDNTPSITNNRIILHNVQGLQSHLKDIQTDRRFMQADVICVTETWLRSEDTNDKLRLNGFKFEHSPRSHCYDESNQIFADLKKQAHGGVGFYYKWTQTVQRLSIPVTNIENICFLLPGIGLIVAVVYRPQSYPVKHFTTALQQLVNHLQGMSRNTIIMGDFNQNILQKQVTIQNQMSDNGYTQIVQNPTTEMGTLIDHVYCHSSIPTKTLIVPTFFSFHEAIEILLDTNKTT